MSEGCHPFFKVDFISSSTVNGRTTCGFGINFPKGCFLVINRTSFTKDGIAETLRYYGVQEAIFARFIGFVDTFFTALAMPFMVITYVLLFIIGILAWVFLWPFFLISCHMLSPGWVTLHATMIILAIGIPLSIFTIVCLPIIFFCTVLQIFVPELTCYVFQLHKWGKEIRS